MRARWMVMVALVCVIFVCPACGESGAGECRIYIVDSGAGSIDGLYVVDSPANGNWGPNLLNEPAEYLNEYPTWRVFRFEEGRVLDLKLDYHDSDGAGSTTREGDTCSDGYGIKYDIGNYLFITTFTFD